MFELIVKDGTFVATEAVQTALTEYRAKKLTIEEMKDDMHDLDEAVMKAMKEHGLKSCQIEDGEGHIHSFTIKAATTRVSADVKKMKEDNIFDDYMKQSNVKESLQHSES
jgi:hypothetical protein